MQEVRRQRNAEVNKKLAKIFEPIFRPIKTTMSVIFTGVMVILVCGIALGTTIGVSACIYENFLRYYW
jgi:ABC-type dipeptide/oligopeptide/nickel transport system permease component